MATSIAAEYVSGSTTGSRLDRIEEVGDPEESDAEPTEVASGFESSDCDATEDISKSEESEWDPTEKPKLPYKKGFKINAMHHEPPEPFGIGYLTESPPFPNGWKEMSQIEYCISCLPLEGRTDSSKCRSLTITSTIRTGSDVGAQIVVVDHTMVAKIFDPLYYPGLDEFGYKEPVVYNADGDYCREAAAFEKLQESTEAMAVIPAYYGAWTMYVETIAESSGGKVTLHTRPVRFILMEQLYGNCMAHVSPFRLREEVRSMILKQAIVVETLLFDAGVDHRDLSPRNIMISGGEYKDPDIPVSDIHIDVKVFDFNIAILLSHPKADSRWGLTKPRKKKWPSKIRSPIMRYYGQMMEFSPRGWCSNDEDEAEKWLWNEFHNDDRYVPVTWDPKHPERHPVHQEPIDTKQIPVSNADAGVATYHDPTKERCGSNDSSDEGSEGKNEGDVESSDVKPDKDTFTREDSVMKAHA
jgi:hypothetical protein